MLLFENPGLMPLEAATTFGINVKMGENPIGFFGTGLKYAIAVTLRLGGTFRLFLGEVEYEFYVKDEDFRGKEFGMIRLRKRNSPLKRWSYQKLAYTTELGKHWEPWMAVREIESNTRDENGASRHCDTLEIPFIDNNTTMIIIECEEMENAYNEEVIFMPEGLTLLTEYGSCEVYDAPSNHVFFRGLRVTDMDKPSMFTYNFTDRVTLTEDRTSKWPYSDQIRAMQALQSLTDVVLLDKIMDAEEDSCWEAGLPWDTNYGDQGSTYIAQVGYRFHSGGTLPKRMKSYYEDLVEEDTQEKFLDVKLTEIMVEEIRGLVKTYSPEHRKEILVQLNIAVTDDEITF
tara:strand:+ start:13672 stop:14703 length:1032 start_codon:yes stop_codon:yes gene_type:complete